MKYGDIVDAIRNKTGMREEAIRKAIERLAKKSKVPITSRQAALLYAYRKGIKIERFAEPEEIAQLQTIQFVQREERLDSRGIGSKEKREIRERTFISPYDVPLKAFQIDEELIRDCKLTRPYRAAVREATLTLETRIRRKLNLPENIIGRDLINEARKRGVFKRSVPAEEEGLFFLYSGTIAWFRNPPSHRKIVYEKDEAVKIILFIDYLLKLFDKLCLENNIQ